METALATPSLAAAVLDITRVGATLLWDHASAAASEPAARVTGRAASWADRASDGFDEWADRAAGRIASASFTAAEAVGRHAERVCDRLAVIVRSCGEGLGDRVVHLGESLSG
jgi:hypothetical protein